MKKICYLLVCMLGFTMAANAAEENVPPQCDKRPPMEKGMKQRPPHMNLEKRLNLTDAQVAKARENRMEAQKKLKPIMEKLKADRAKIDQIKASNASDDKKLEQIKPIRKEMKALRKQANVIREDNMKQFEAILTPVQKEELQAIKDERKEMKKHHPHD